MPGQGGLVTSPAVTSPLPSQAGPARRAATGRRSHLLGRGPYRPYARGRKEKRTAGVRQRKGDERERMREKKRRLEAGGVRQRVGH